MRDDRDGDDRDKYKSEGESGVEKISSPGLSSWTPLEKSRLSVLSTMVREH